MQTLTPQKENQICAALVAKIESVAGARNVIADEPLLDSKQDVVKKICVRASDNKTEVVYIKIDFLGFEDLTDVGCEDNPGAYAVYNLHVFQGYREKRADGSTSLNDIKNLVLNLRNRFLETENNARILIAGCESTPLVQKSYIVLEADPLTGAYGHFTDLTAKIEVL